MSTDANTLRLYARLPEVALEAHAVADALQASGVGCYVRCWHLGQTGWFVVHGETYERLNFPTHVDAMISTSFRNQRLVRQAVAQGRECGCYFCGERFPAQAIEGFTSDGCALCPHCDVDAVLVGVTDAAILAAGTERWFTGVAPPREVPA